MMDDSAESADFRVPKEPKTSASPEAAIWRLLSILVVLVVFAVLAIWGVAPATIIAVGAVVVKVLREVLRQHRP